MGQADDVVRNDLKTNCRFVKVCRGCDVSFTDKAEWEYHKTHIAPKEYTNNVKRNLANREDKEKRRARFNPRDVGME